MYLMGLKFCHTYQICSKDKINCESSCLENTVSIELYLQNQYVEIFHNTIKIHISRNHSDTEYFGGKSLILIMWSINKYIILP